MSDKILTVNPNEVEYKLEEANWGYVNTNKRSDDVGFGNVSVFPVLYSYVADCCYLPSLGESYRHLMALHCDKKYKRDHRAYRRAKKLVQDFYRDLHTYGLLGQTTEISVVTYQKGLDLRYNIDYVIGLSSSFMDDYQTKYELVGVQATMMHPRNWKKKGVDFRKVKFGRRQRRGNIKSWEGPMYWLTNRDRPYAKSIGSVWLFGQEHVRDLMDKIGGLRDNH